MNEQTQMLVTVDEFENLTPPKWEAIKNRLIKVGLDAAYIATIKADEANDYYAESERLRAENTDLRTKLEVAEATIKELDNALEQCSILLSGSQAELHDLRVRCAQLQPEPDWNKAPSNAQWWAIDDNGQAYWFVEKPKCHHKFGYWGNSGGAILADEMTCPFWESSLRQRPT